MHTVETKFKMCYTDEQYVQARAYVENMKKHKERVYWIGKEGKSDDELILGHIAHKILSGFYNTYDQFGSSAIIEMINAKLNGHN